LAYFGILYQEKSGNPAQDTKHRFRASATFPNELSSFSVTANNDTRKNRMKEIWLPWKQENLLKHSPHIATKRCIKGKNVYLNVRN
jgi:hypothetical protein